MTKFDRVMSLVISVLYVIAIGGFFVAFFWEALT